MTNDRESLLVKPEHLGRARRLWRLGATAYIAAIHVLLTLGFISIFYGYPGRSNPDDSYVGAFRRDMLRYHARVDRNVPDRSVLFFGDSHVQGLAVTAVADSSVNFGIGHETTAELLQRLPDYSSLKRAEIIIVATGFNDLASYGDQEILINFEKVLALLDAPEHIVLCGLLPVNESDSGRVAYNERIATLNRELAMSANRDDHISFVDTSRVLMNSDGQLDRRFHNGDGVHLSPAGYQIWIGGISKAVQSYYDASHYAPIESR